MGHHESSPENALRRFSYEPKHSIYVIRAGCERDLAWFRFTAHPSPERVNLGGLNPANPAREFEARQFPIVAPATNRTHTHAEQFGYLSDRKQFSRLR